MFPLPLPGQKTATQFIRQQRRRWIETKLVGELAGLDGLDKVKVWDIIEEEMKLRQQEFALQKDLVQQQIALMKAKVSAMQKGEALIKIEGDGLKPHLEAFMWEILRTIQTRVNADGLDMLLGA